MPKSETARDGVCTCMCVKTAPPIPPQDLAFSLEHSRLQAQWEKQFREQQQQMLDKLVSERKAEVMDPAHMRSSSEHEG